MKIAFLNIYSGMVNRGAESVVHELASRLVQHHQVTLFQGGPPTPSEPASYQQIEIPGVKMIFPEPPAGLWSKWQRRWYQDQYHRQVAVFTHQCIHFLTKQNFDFIFPTNGPVQLQILKRSHLKSKLIYINHGQFHPHIFRLAGWDTWMALRCKPEVFVALTHPAYKWARNWTTKETRVVKIPYGIDLEKFSPKVKTAKVDLPKPIVLCVAGLQKYKRVELLIRAVGEVNQRQMQNKAVMLNSPACRRGRFQHLLPARMRFPYSLDPETSLPAQAGSGRQKTSLLVLGDGPLKSELTELGNQLIGQENFKIMSVPYADMPHYYAACNVFSLPSESLEAFGVSYLESLASNKPVVAPDDPARQELLGSGGLTVNVGEVGKYASALTTALNKNWGKLPRQQAEKFGWDKITQQYESLLASL